MTRIPIPPIERFLNKVDFTPGCWNWMGATCGTKSTYGHFQAGTRSTDPKIKAHRFMWEHYNGPIPEGMEIDHLCRNTLCVNPAHLEPVTPEENSFRARKSICVHGHDLTIERNQAFDKQGRRRGCAECNRIRVREAYRQKVKG